MSEFVFKAKNLSGEAWNAARLSVRDVLSYE